MTSQLKWSSKYYQIGNLTPSTATEEQLLEFHSTRNMDAKGNTCDLKLNNPIVDFYSDGTPRGYFTNASGLLNFQAATPRAGFSSFEERIEFYAVHDDDITTDPVSDENSLFIGQIMDVGVISTDKDNTVKLTCSDRTFNILNRIAPNDYEDISIPLIIQNVVRTFTEYDLSETAYNAAGQLGKGPGYVYPIDVRLFSEGIKQTSTSVNASSTKVITAPSATFVTNGVEVGDLVRNVTTNQVAIVRAVNSETSLTLSKVIFTTSANIQVSDGFVQDFRPDGTAFPSISFGFGKKPLYEWVSNLSTEENTNADKADKANYVCKRPMMFYVDGKNRLHWFYPDNTPSYEFSLGVKTAVGSDTRPHLIYEADMEKGVFDIINFIIFDCGNDMDGSPITWYAQDPYAGGVIVKDAYRPFITIAPRMRQLDAIINPTKVTYNGNDDYTVSGFPFVPAWDRLKRSCPDLATYKTRFKEEALRQGEAKAMDIIKKTANPRWRGKLTIRGENLSPSDLIRYSDKRNGIDRILVRMKSVQHNITKTGWYTTLSLEEDVAEGI
jgi:hypothetical protein